MIKAKDEYCFNCEQYHPKWLEGCKNEPLIKQQTPNKVYGEYTIKENLGIPQLKVTISWIDKNDKEHNHETNIIETAETIIGLLSGNILLADLEP